MAFQGWFAAFVHLYYSSGLLPFGDGTSLLYNLGSAELQSAVFWMVVVYLEPLPWGSKYMKDAYLLDLEYISGTYFGAEGVYMYIYTYMYIHTHRYNWRPRALRLRKYGGNSDRL